MYAQRQNMHANQTSFERATPLPAPSQEVAISFISYIITHSFLFVKCFRCGSYTQNNQPSKQCADDASQQHSQSKKSASTGRQPSPQTVLLLKILLLQNSIDLPKHLVFFRLSSIDLCSHDKIRTFKIATVRRLYPDHTFVYSFDHLVSPNLCFCNGIKPIILPKIHF